MSQPQQPDMNELLRQAAEMQAQLQQAQDEILNSEVTGTAGGGLVSVTMSGSSEVSDVQIKPEAVDPEDVETLQDLIVAALRDAHSQVGQLTEQKLGPISGAAGGDPFGGMM